MLDSSDNIVLIYCTFSSAFTQIILCEMRVSNLT